ncbi:hypothetical protein K7X08_014806 [Anisodus acutangulus]|uniref:Uncharacterized protein n=1 Tax=Anisodus acutangulus TaxID=402998 RepID=A0A9Q1LLU0_9SOLA|nr:hypothetical protein K7X08_014806 [Anisodus acutangulus]
MAKPKQTKNASDRQKWNKVFNALVHMLTSQQTQLESLAKERMILEDRIKLQNNRWVYDINTFQDQIYEMKKDFTVQDMERVLAVAKSELVVGLKQRDVVMFKRKFEDADSELADFRELFDYLSHKFSEPNDVPRAATDEKTETRKKVWEDENFIWNQFNKLEQDMAEQLRRKCTELEHANEKIQVFTRNIEELQSSNTNKDNTIAALRTQIAKLESDFVRKGEEISKLSTELELLKKSRSASITPVLRCFTAGSGTFEAARHVPWNGPEEYNCQGRKSIFTNP